MPGDAFQISANSVYLFVVFLLLVVTMYSHSRAEVARKQTQAFSNLHAEAVKALRICVAKCAACPNVSPTSNTRPSSSNTDAAGTHAKLVETASGIKFVEFQHLSTTDDKVTSDVAKDTSWGVDTPANTADGAHLGRFQHGAPITDKRLGDRSDDAFWIHDKQAEVSNSNSAVPDVSRGRYKTNVMARTSENFIPNSSRAHNSFVDMAVLSSTISSDVTQFDDRVADVASSSDSLVPDVQTPSFNFAEKKQAPQPPQVALKARGRRLAQRWCKNYALSPEPGHCPVGMSRGRDFRYCGMWSIRAGSCTISAEDCIQSPGYPKNILTNHRCRFSVKPYQSNFIAPHVLVNQGTLKINSKWYSSGDQTPEIMPFTAVDWSSGAKSGSGWKMCPASHSTPVVLKLGSLHCEYKANSSHFCVSTDKFSEKKIARRSVNAWYTYPASCEIYILGRQTLAFERFDVLNDDWLAFDSPWLAPSGVTAVSGSSPTFKLTSKDNVMTPFTMTGVGGILTWSSVVPSPSRRRDLLKRGGWRFCVERNTEDTAWRTSAECQRTCGSCDGMPSLFNDLLSSCTDDSWFSEACVRYAGVGTKPPTTLMSPDEKCTTWNANQVKNGLMADPVYRNYATKVPIDDHFASRLRQHCPYSCWICHPCGLGQRQTEQGQGASCADCPFGRYQDEYRQVSCKQCQHGKFSGVNATSCTDCPAGRYSRGPVAACIKCTAGKYSIRPGASACSMCPSGKYGSEEGATALTSGCKDCIIGRYSHVSGAVVCQDCDPGSFRSDPGGLQCDKCIPGRYQGRSGGSLCEQCGLGEYASNSGAVACTKCGKGTYNQHVARTDCARCAIGNYSTSTGQTACYRCPGALTTEFPGAMDLQECVCPKNMYGLDGTNEDTCRKCPPGFHCPGGHPYGDPAKDMSPVLEEGVMSLPWQPLLALTCQGKRKICSGRRTPLYATVNNGTNWAQVCAGGRMDQACAACPEWHYKTDAGCEKCNGFDSVLFWFAMPLFFASMVGLHVWWNSSSVKERADQKAAVVCVNLYFLNCQILGALQTVQIEWQPPFSDFLQLTSYMRMRMDFLKPSCGLQFSPLREYVTRGLIPLLGILTLYSVYAVFRGAHKLQHDLGVDLSSIMQKVSPTLRKWRYFINTTGAIYILFSCGITLTAFLPHQCIDNPGGMLTSMEWPVVLCEMSDDQYGHMTGFSVFLILLYVVSFPALCAWQVVRYPVAAVTDRYFFIKYKFMFGNYNAHARYFSLVIMLRNVCISLISVFLQRDTFLQMICMIGAMMCYLVTVCLSWPWLQPMINRLDIATCMGLCGIMAVGSGFIEQEVNQGNLLILLSVVLIFLGIAFVCTGTWFFASYLGSRYDYTIFLSHAKGTGGAVARLFKMSLKSHLTGDTHIFLDSDNLVSLYELHVFVQHTRNLVLLLTPNCYAREWVAVELVTSYVHTIQVTMISVNGGPPPDQTFIENIPNVFRSCLEGRFPEMGIDEDILRDAFNWISNQTLLAFDVFSDSGEQHRSMDTLLGHLTLGTRNRIKTTLFTLWLSVQGKSQAKLADADREDDSIHVYLTREKDVDVQQEASVICLRHVLNASLRDVGVYLPPISSDFSANYEILAKMPKGGMMALCLTKSVLACVDSVCEMIAGTQNGHFIVLVQIDADFPYPGDVWYEQFRNGDILNLGEGENREKVYEALMHLLRALFEDISIPFNANAPEATIMTAAKSVVSRYDVFQSGGRRSGVVGQMLMRLNDTQLGHLDSFMQERLPSVFYSDITKSTESYDAVKTYELGVSENVAVSGTPTDGSTVVIGCDSQDVSKPLLSNRSTKQLLPDARDSPTSNLRPSPKRRVSKPQVSKPKSMAKVVSAVKSVKGASNVQRGVQAKTVNQALDDKNAAPSVIGMALPATVMETSVSSPSVPAPEVKGVVSSPSSPVAKTKTRPGRSLGRRMERSIGTKKSIGTKSIGTKPVNSDAKGEDTSENGGRADTMNSDEIGKREGSVIQTTSRPSRMF